MAFNPQVYPQSHEAILQEGSGAAWTPLYWHECSFSPEIFSEVMMNLIRNPNINSNHLFRADILSETPYASDLVFDAAPEPKIAHFNKLNLKTVIVRRLIPRNALVDKPLDQTCLIHDQKGDLGSTSLVVYFPHISSPAESPFYHPAVRGIAFLHSLKSSSEIGIISIHYSFFTPGPKTPFLERTAQHLLRTLHKHGQGIAAGYVKRVQHDAILPQAIVQNRYSRLKAKYARALIAAWVEATDPAKHVFEDLGIAAFLIELWTVMYQETTEFPGFVDIGCGNGLLTHILIQEGYFGWGFDARRRKSWEIYPSTTREHLRELVLIPNCVECGGNDDKQNLRTDPQGQGEEVANPALHSGVFPKGTFIISNHADELTPWTPILAHLSKSPFMMIPCCSHNLTGSKFRAPPPKEPGVSSSTYASLVTWVANLAGSCGWEIEKEMLRIPSTRNTALIGRKRKFDYAEVDVAVIIEEYGGSSGWEQNVMKLVKSVPRGH